MTLLLRMLNAANSVGVRAATAGWERFGPRPGSGSFIHTKHQGPFGWVEIETHYIPHLLLEFRVIGQFESFDPVGLHVKTPPSHMYRAAGHTEMPGEGAHAPVGRIRQSGFQGRIQNLRRTGH